MEFINLPGETTLSGLFHTKGAGLAGSHGQPPRTPAHQGVAWKMEPRNSL